MGEGRRSDLDLLSVEDVGGWTFLLLRAAARTAAVVDPEELAKSAKPRKPELLMIVPVAR